MVVAPPPRLPDRSRRRCATARSCGPRLWNACGSLSSCTSWDLEVEDWQPGADATETVRPVRSLRLRAPRHRGRRCLGWRTSPGSVATERRSTSAATGQLTTALCLELGEVSDTFRISVNGVAVGRCDPLHPRVDLAGLLRRGTNVIEVEVASTLLNRLRTVTPAVYDVAQRQAYGLLGPVRLVPYVDQPVRR